MTKLVSLDTSTKKSGCALYINGKLQEWKLLDCSKTTDIDIRINEMGSALLSLLDKWKPDIICIEEPKGSGRNVQLVKNLSEIIGIVRAWSIRNDCSYSEIMPSVWRKWANLSQGNKKREELKRESMKLVEKRFSITLDNDDVCDAILIGAAIINQAKAYEEMDLFE